MPNQRDPTQVVTSLSLSRALLARVTEARADGESQSEFIRGAVERELRARKNAPPPGEGGGA